MCRSDSDREIAFTLERTNPYVVSFDPASLVFFCWIASTLEHTNPYVVSSLTHWCFWDVVERKWVSPSKESPIETMFPRERFLPPRVTCMEISTATELRSNEPSVSVVLSDIFFFFL